MQMRQRTSSHMHTAASETHKHGDVTFQYFLSIHARTTFQLWLDDVRHKHHHTVQSDIRLESHFLIIHIYSSISVHECHVNEHRQGGKTGGRERGGEEVERGKETHH